MCGCLVALILIPRYSVWMLGYLRPEPSRRKPKEVEMFGNRSSVFLSVFFSLVFSFSLSLDVSVYIIKKIPLTFILFEFDIFPSDKTLLTLRCSGTKYVASAINYFSFILHSDQKINMCVCVCVRARMHACVRVCM